MRRKITFLRYFCIACANTHVWVCVCVCVCVSVFAESPEGLSAADANVLLFFSTSVLLLRVYTLFVSVNTLKSVFVEIWYNFPFHVKGSISFIYDLYVWQT